MMFRNGSIARIIPSAFRSFRNHPQRSYSITPDNPVTLKPARRDILKNQQEKSSFLQDNPPVGLRRARRGNSKKRGVPALSPAEFGLQKAAAAAATSAQQIHAPKHVLSTKDIDR